MRIGVYATHSDPGDPEAFNLIGVAKTARAAETIAAKFLGRKSTGFKKVSDSVMESYKGPDKFIDGKFVEDAVVQLRKGWYENSKPVKGLNKTAAAMLKKVHEV